MTKSDAEVLMKLVRWLHQEAENQRRTGDADFPREFLAPVFEVVVSSTPMAVDSVHMGSGVYPKVHQKGSGIVVYSREPWGVVVSNERAVGAAVPTGGEWQLFVLARNDLVPLTVWTVTSPGGHEISAATNFNTNPVQLYRNLLSRKCPAFVSVDTANGNAISLKKKRKLRSASMSSTV